VNFSEVEIQQVCETVFNSVLGWEVFPADRVVNAEQERIIASSVQISGAWDGAVALYCPEPLARQAACGMFGLNANDIAAEDVQDALGELANMIGGNLKALLPEPCYLSLPTVADGTVFTLRIRGSEVQCQVPLECQGFPVTVTVLKRKEEAQA